MAEESEIRLIDPRTQRAYPTAAGTEVVHASRRVCWRSPLVFEVHRMEAHEYDEHVVEGHQLLLNLGAPVRLGWKEESRRREGVLATGAICIQTDGDSNAPRWHDRMLFATAAIPTAMVGAALLDRMPAPSETFRKRHCVDDPGAYSYVRALAAELRSPTEPLYAESLANGFLLHLLVSHSQSLRPARGAKPKGKLDPRLLSHVLELIQGDLASDLSLQRLATSCAYSPFQFARLFKATTGLAPHAFVLSLRLERASRLLTERAAEREKGEPLPSQSSATLKNLNPEGA